MSEFFLPGSLTPTPDATTCAICGDPALHQERDARGRKVGACKFHKGTLAALQLANRSRAAAVVDDRMGGKSRGRFAARMAGNR